MQGYLSRRDELIATARPGLEGARALSALTDEAVSALAETASSRLGRTWAVVALGGYGAGRLLPSSDLDLLLLSEDTGEPVRQAAKELLYPLWDGGLTVGHQVRTRKEHLRACGGDLKTLTASLTARVTAGDAAYGDRILGEVALNARRRSARLLPELAARPRPGSPYLLEPDLKEGAGGQRDLDELTWTSAVLLGDVRNSPEELGDLGFLTSEDLTRLSDAGDVLASARWRMHSGGGSPVMDLEAAAGLGEDAQRVQEALAGIDDVLLRVRARIAAPPTRRLVRTRGRSASPGIGDGAPSASKVWSAEQLFAAIAAGESEELERAAFRGHLDTLVPGTAELMTLRRPGLSHTLTVGAHSIGAACELARLEETPPDGSLAHSAEDAGDVRAAIVAALCHDQGKREPGPGHAERGAGAAHAAASACGLDEADAEHAARLVRLHLLLPEAALRTDVSADAPALDRLASLVGDTRTLGALHLLSAADSAATGPGAWSSWHAALLAELVAAVRARLADRTLAAPAAVLGEALALMGPAPCREASWLANAPARYLTARGADAAAADARLVADLLRDRRGAPPRLRVSPGAVDGTWVVAVASRDRPGLFATLAGVLALVGLDVLAAVANGWGGVAIDVFTVRSATLAPVSPDVWARVDRLLDAASRNHLSLATRLRERRRHYTPSHASDPSITFDASDPGQVIVEVEAPDRVGLLYDLAAALTDSGLDIGWANALVQDGRARDVFRVTSAEGQVPEPGVLGHVSMRIRERLSS